MSTSSPVVMSVVVVIRKLLAALWSVVGAVKRCFCCVRRRRDSCPSLPVLLQPATDTSYDSACWGDWDGGPSSVVCEGRSSAAPRQMSAVQEQIFLYRQQQQMRQSEPVPEQPNLLEELAPKIARKPQVVIYARPDDDEQRCAARTSLSCTDALMQVGGELGEWDEEGGETHWDDDSEDVAPEHVACVLQQQRQQRQQQRLAREQRKQQQLQQHRDNRAKMATKIS
ncbi:receptor-binding cancer antigen expressed on SiSo cells isoform X2 [Hyalella azteca]|uniref:Receptor-binding cancer antigen expressed on SiSo cells isoform X2 n=1 Tax=Hyalella azteca TaxID=294128 RepID=A0A8B7P575_HYAAZ|nr:receptor-binding cancer antigen expressed on SiSo cells isoform X2 [Hyalella azteca]